MLVNLKQIRRGSGLTQIDAAEKLEVPFPTYRAWEQGINAPRSGDLIKIAEFFGVTVDDLLGRNASLPANAIPVRSGSFANAPLYGTIAAGSPIEMSEVLEDVGILESIREKHLNGFFLKVSGDSMDKVILHGGYAFLDPDRQPRSGDVVAVNVDGSDATLKRYSRTGNNVVLLPDSTNATHQPVMVEDERARILGTMVWMTYPAGFRY
ncbi:MAG: helix-turn-helix domain-containing protein [Coriobacteriia bacterium]|nr:helix-turn-helix domain-containing protein [Coriobacteriia bacterium]MCL2745624.1 helix-turn-helix domain-containing protein [Coriobacteriia bacterium]MCL2871349.1 helix-turn-helix domain-containing protein [Coriobacteriia bacterium]